MIVDLTGLPIANSSLLDEATAAAEAYHIAHDTVKNKKKFFVSQDCHPSTIAVVRERAHLLGDEVVVGDVRTADFSSKEYSGVLVQYPNTYGELFDYKSVSDAIHARGRSLHHRRRSAGADGREDPPARSTPMCVWDPASALVCPWASAVPLPVTWLCRTSTSARCPAVSSE